MNKSFFVLAMVLVACVGAAEHIFIPRDKNTSIKIDGVVGEEEYTRASLLEGMVHAINHRLVNRNVSVYVTSSEEALYMTMSTPVEEADALGGFIAQAKSGGRVFADDCVEFYVINKDVNKGYQFVVNVTNAVVTFIRNDGRASKFDIPFQSASQVHDGRWDVEVAIPWSGMPDIDPLDFYCNVARNFVRANIGYANLTGTDSPLDAKRLIQVKALEGFPGVKVRGADTTLISGRVCLRMEYEGGTLSGAVRENGSDDVPIADGKVVELPEPKFPYKSLVFSVRDPKLGVVLRRGGVPFEMGGTLTDGPVTDKRKIEGLGYCFLRYYPSYDKISVLLDSVDKIVSGNAEVKSPDGASYSGEFKAMSGGTWLAMVNLPEKRALGDWIGRIAVVDADGKSREYDNAFGFTEKSFPFMEKSLGVSSRILPPFEPIVVTNGTELKTVLRNHSLAQNGLLKQVTSKGMELLSKPLQFNLVVDGKRLEESDASLTITDARPNIVRTKAVARYGKWRYQAHTIWEYDGFARVIVRFVPPANEVAEKLTLCAHFKKEEAPFFNSLVDMGRDNPAGAIPEGIGKVWDSSTLPRRINNKGLPVVPGEFTPYIWVGGDERGLSLTFNSPRGFDLLDGVPMIRLNREGDTVLAECDIVSRKGTPGKPVEFEFCFQATPVKPRHAGWKRWAFNFGERFPGLLHILPLEHDSAAGLWTRFAKVPPNGDYSYVKAFKETMKTRIPQFNLCKHFEEVESGQMREYYLSHAGFMKQRFGRDVDGYIALHRWRMLDMSLGQHAMTGDRFVPYSCPSIIPIEDEAYQYHKAEWATVKQYWVGVADRCFLSKRYIDYLLWCYDKQLDAGIDGFYVDEAYVFPQTNPELSLVRDYKDRVIPEMNILETRELIKRMAYLLDSRKRPEQLLVIHFTNTNIVPILAFATIGLDWEYNIETNMLDYVPLDHIRAHSTGLQAGFVPMTIVRPRLPKKPPQISNQEYLTEYQRIYRTGLALMYQHEISSFQQIFGDYTEAWKGRYVLWAFGTHKENCDFIPYYSKDKKFSVSGDFIVGAYKRGNSMLFIVTNLGDEAETVLTIDRSSLSIDKNAAIMDAMTGEKLSWEPECRLKVAQREYRFVFVGSQDYGEMLTPPPVDRRFIK